MALHQFADPRQTTQAQTSGSIVEQGHDDDLLTVREVSRALRVDDTTVRRWIKNGALEAIALPHRGSRQAYRIRRGVLRTIFSPEVQGTLTL